jgi:hypothetical protein
MRHWDIVSRCCRRSLLDAAACWIVKPNCSSRGGTDDMLEFDTHRVLQEVTGSSARCLDNNSDA